MDYLKNSVALGLRTLEQERLKDRAYGTKMSSCPGTIVNDL